MRGSMMLAGLLALAACNGGDDAPGGVTPGEASELNDAAAMLDANSVAIDTVVDDDAETGR